MDRKPLTLHKLREMHKAGEKIAMLTCYDAAFAALLDDAGIDCLLVGDSLGMVLQGRSSTNAVALEDIAYHLECVSRAQPSAWLIGDLPFGSYHEGPDQAMRSSVALMAAGAQMVKLEGGGWTAETVRFLVERGVPVCAHLGRDEAGAALLKAHTRELADAGAAMVVLELMPSALAREITEGADIITIGIGAGAGCSGQVLVLHDMLHITPGRKPRFVRNFMEGSASLHEAVSRYVADVKCGAFPDEAVHGY
jgi:3-methyl-2-oxobutanoate hydroxymethyltransferase